jgi:hypothetical protein
MRPQGGKRARPGSPLRRKPAIRARTPTRHRRMPRRRMSGPIVTAAPPDKAIAVKGTHPGLKTSAKTKINADDRIAPSSDGAISQVLKRRSKATFPPQSPGESPVAPRLVSSELAASKHIYGAVVASHRICANRRACLRALAVSLGIRSGFWCPWSHCGPCLMARRLVEQTENFNPLCPVSDATDSAVTRLVSVFSFPNPPVLDLERGRVSRRDEPGFPAGVRPVENNWFHARYRACRGQDFGACPSRRSRHRQIGRCSGCDLRRGRSQREPTMVTLIAVALIALIASAFGAVFG